MSGGTHSGRTSESGIVGGYVSEIEGASRNERIESFCHAFTILLVSFCFSHCSKCWFDDSRLIFISLALPNKLFSSSHCFYSRYSSLLCLNLKFKRFSHMLLVVAVFLPFQFQISLVFVTSLFPFLIFSYKSSSDFLIQNAASSGWRCLHFWHCRNVGNCHSVLLFSSSSLSLPLSDLLRVTVFRASYSVSAEYSVRLIRWALQRWTNARALSYSSLEILFWVCLSFLHCLSLHLMSLKHTVCVLY